ncbi:MAG: hypothetical protein SH820_17690 [Xanthomonadales bacterium]|nr:hypothetical protein [Deltaproteobacteria bacterium]MDZ4731765.1 hypothetical protein [Xanthomonadales bacterium]
MTIANVSQGNTRGLPPALRTAQEAIHLPEVREMLRRLSEYRLGIFMPHMHDEQTGEFQPLPDEVMQVESGLEVSFQPTQEIANQTDHFLPVGWFWRAGASTPLAVCEMIDEEGPGDAERYVKHKMPKGNQDDASFSRPVSLCRHR